MQKLSRLLTIAVSLGAATTASATPSTTVWAPSTTAVQGFLIPHLTYDTYFGRTGTAAGSPIYPVTTGLTMGVLPYENLQLEVGFDLLLPSSDPFVFNAKLGTQEDKLFAWQPSLAVGIFGVGTASASTDWDMIYGQLQHSLPWGGFISAGGYVAATDTVKNQAAAAGVANPNGAGFIGAIGSPDINLNLPWLKKVVLAADIQTGNNAFGAGGVAASLYFTDSIAVLTGPVFFMDSKTQPGAASWMWTVQLDIDMPLRPAPAAATPAPTAPNPTKT